VFAFRIVRAGGEGTIAPLFEHHLFAALRTKFLKHHVGRRELAARLDLSGGLAVGITGAREKLPEPAPLHRHWPTAVVANLFGRFGVRFLTGLIMSFRNIAGRLA